MAGHRHHCGVVGSSSGGGGGGYVFSCPIVMKKRSRIIGIRTVRNGI